MRAAASQTLSPDICGSRVILFLGAGASAPLGLPLMDSFMDVLDAQMNPEYLPIVQSMFEMPGKTRDLEILFDTLDEYDMIARHLRDDRNWSGIVERSQAQGVHNLTWAVDKIRRLAARVVLQEYSDVEEAEVVALYDDLLLLLAQLNTQRHVPVFTTNYDLAIETLADLSAHRPDFVDGFTSDNVRRWNPSIFHRYKATPTYEPTILLFKLHGSCNWRLNTETGVVTKESTAELVSPDSAYDNELMWPAQTKTVKEGPYEVNYDYLEACLMQAELCVVVGFSFRDDVIRQYFRRALRENANLKMAIIDPRADSIIQDTLRMEAAIIYKGPQSRIIRARGRVAYGIPTRFERRQLPMIVRALSRLDLPWDKDLAASFRVQQPQPRENGSDL